MKKEIEKDFNKFWKEIICNKNGTINIKQLKKELYDYHYLMQQVPIVYCHITEGKFSKLMYPAETIIREANDIISRDYIHKDDLRTLLE